MQFRCSDREYCGLKIRHPRRNGCVLYYLVSDRLFFLHVVSCWGSSRGGPDEAACNLLYCPSPVSLLVVPKHICFCSTPYSPRDTGGTNTLRPLGGLEASTVTSGPPGSLQYHQWKSHKNMEKQGYFPLNPLFGVRVLYKSPLGSPQPRQAPL